jgi:hypothetical protein
VQKFIQSKIANTIYIHEGFWYRTFIL